MGVEAQPLGLAEPAAMRISRVVMDSFERTHASGARHGILPCPEARSPGHLRSLTVCCLIGLSVLLARPALHAAEAKSATAKPSVVIPVEPLGYGRPGELYLGLQYSQVSLDFVDASHLLFTFQKKELLRHSGDELPDEIAQLIHAVVLGVPDGKVSASADWRMHDRQRYLWPLGRGAFLVRQRDTLFLTDSSLELRPYGHFPGRLEAVQVSPGGDLLVAQTDEPEKQEQSQEADRQTGSAPVTVATPSRSGIRKPILLRVFRVKDRVVIAKSRGLRPMDMPINGSGFVESFRGKHDEWTLSFMPLTGSPAPESSKPFAEVSSTCQPVVAFVSEDAIVAERCTPSGGRLATFLTLDGKLLWERKQSGISPTMANSQDGRRVAQGVLSETGGAPDIRPLLSSEISGQRVDVFDTASGKLLLSAPASPIYDAGQNFALSPDGRRFAILHGGAIEIYDLAPEGN